MEKVKNITIITICFNCKEDLRNTISSVRQQEYKDKEFVIIDGGSTDGTLELIKSEEDIIDFWVSEPDHGIYDAINKGIEHANGKWLVCMNAGDIFADKDVLKNIFSSEIPEDKTVIYSDYWAKTPNGYLNLCKMDRAKGKVMHQAFIYQKCLHAKYGLYLVTKPYICSDFQFMLMIPENEYYKTPHLISITNFGGVSQSSTWCDECSLGLKVAFRIETLNSAFIKLQLAKLKKMMPNGVKSWVKRNILKQESKKLI